MRDTWARIFYGVTGFAAAIGVLFSSWLTVAETPAEVAEAGSVAKDAIQANPELFTEPVIRGLNTFVYFTIWSNILVAIVCLMLLANPHRSGKVFDVFRVFSLTAITITGIVYNAVLRAEANSVGFAEFNTNVLHVFVPIAAVVGWLIFGPRIKFSGKTVLWCAVIGLVWLVFTFIRGGIIHWYPYPFLNVDSVGFGAAVITCIGILIVAMLFASLILWLDKKLPGPKPWLDADSESEKDRSSV